MKLSALASAVALLAVAAVLGVVSYRLYDTGRPGQPAFARDLDPRGVSSLTRVYVAGDAGVRTTVGLLPGDDPTERTTTLAVTPADPTSCRSSLCSVAVMIVLERQATFRDSPELDELRRVPSADPALQVFVGRLTSAGVRVVGTPATSALQRDNARYTVSSPAIGSSRCDDLERVVGALGPATTPEEVDELVYTDRCANSPVPPRPDTVTLFVDEDVVSSGPIRIDSATPPAENPVEGSSIWPDVPLLQWSAQPGAAVLEPVTASFVSINEEASGQSGLFLSGVLVGLAGALAPMGVGQLAAGLRHARSRPEPAGPVPGVPDRAALARAIRRPGSSRGPRSP